MSPTSSSKPLRNAVLDDRSCNLFQECETPEAPLCPIRENSVSHGIWYPKEAICRGKRFQDLPWIKNQIRIANLGLTTDDGYFTVRMLNSLQATDFNKNLKGADPNCPDAEYTWFQQRPEKKISTPQKKHRTKVFKTENLQLQLC